METNSKNFYWDVGNRIRAFRQEKRYTVEELSEKAGISTKYMYQIESGKVSFSTEILYKIASSLGVPADAILVENSMSIENNILSEVMGRFTAEEKNYIKKAIIHEIIEET